ncbi:phosphatidylinositol mannoside acyltransferase [Fodinicola acaciae]|uniref:phosphatidylinositol mannoside acyltransferase n=1 Tax=Fodinicola acaciae TaxID=2681555 RepID=UPI0013D50C82|nr:phosphatidylinositol mannoside acyltransferase [Fodinicola acaciae]
MSRLGEAAAAAGYLTGWRVVRALPARLAARIFQAAADRSTRRGGKGVQRLRSNLRRVVGAEVGEAELDALVRDGMRSYARYWLEAFRFPSVPVSRLHATLDMANPELLDELHAQGKGVIVALTHSGNWDHAGAWAAYRGMPVVSVQQRLKPEVLYDRFVAYRASIGIDILPLTGGDRSTMDVLAERLAGGQVVCLLADRDLSASSVEVDFFGGVARMPPGPARLAVRTGAPLIVAQLWYTPTSTAGHLVGPIVAPEGLDERAAVAAMTQRMADAFADSIRAHPADWHMLQRVWPDESGDPAESTETSAKAG